MDNMKFSTNISSMGNVSEGEDDRKECDVLEVFNIYPTNRIFRVEVNDFISIQKPNAVLVPESCKNFIINNINKATYKYDESKNTIEVCISVFDMCDIYIELKETFINERNYKAIVNELERKLEDMDPFETIETFSYPQWNTYDEFINLPDWKYFKCVKNLRQYISGIQKNDSNEYDRNYVNNNNLDFKLINGKLIKVIKIKSDHTKAYINELQIDLSNSKSTHDVSKWPIVLYINTIAPIQIDRKQNETLFNLVTSDLKIREIKYNEIFRKSHDFHETILKSEPDNKNYPATINKRQIKHNILFYFSVLKLGWILKNTHLYRNRLNSSYTIELEFIFNIDNMTMTVRRLKHIVEDEIIGFCNIPTYQIWKRINGSNSNYTKPSINLLTYNIITYKGLQSVNDELLLC